MNRNLKEFVNYQAISPEPSELPGESHVTILLAHFNSGSLLAPQLDSLGRQSHRDWSLIISDDGQSNDWLTTTFAFAITNPDKKISLVTGPQKGFAKNFLSMVQLVGPCSPFAAYCDQDDVWLPHKLERALKVLRQFSADQPALYCSRTTICDADLHIQGRSPHFKRNPGFRNALVQNIGGGNTMVMNRAALDLLQDTAHVAGDVVSHDWWTYQIIAGAGGHVIYDAVPTLLYRQHGANSFGANQSTSARAKRILGMFNGRYRRWNEKNCRALKRAHHWLTPENKKVLALFDTARNGRFLWRLFALSRSGIYRQTLQGQLALWLAATLKKL